MELWIFLLISSGYISGWHGGQIHGGDPKVLKNLAWCLPQTIAVSLICPWWTIPFTALNYLKTTSHGRGFRLWEPMEENSDLDGVERYGLKYLYGKIPLSLYKVLIMSLTGVLSVSGTVIAFYCVDPLMALPVVIGGLWKGINALIYDKNNLSRETMDGVCAFAGILAGIELLPGT